MKRRTRAKYIMELQKLIHENNTKVGKLLTHRHAAPVRPWRPGKRHYFYVRLSFNTRSSKQINLGHKDE